MRNHANKLINRVELRCTAFHLALGIVCLFALWPSIASAQDCTLTLGPVTAYTASTSPVPITITGTMPPTGTQLTIAGITTPSAMNGTWTITKTGAHTATLNSSSSMIGTFSGAGSTVYLYLGAGVNCIIANNGFGTPPAQNEEITFAPSAGQQVIAFMYLCTTSTCLGTNTKTWAATTAYSASTTDCSKPSSVCIQPSINNPCDYMFMATTGGTSRSTQPTWSTTPCQSSAATITDGTVVWSAITLSIENQSGTPLSCFTWSSSTPAGLQVSTIYQNYALYCPSIPAGVKSIQAVCNVSYNSGANWACSQVSIMAEAYTGLCSVTPCIDVDGFNPGSGTGTSMSGATSQSTRFTNELFVTLGGVAMDQPLSPNGGCTAIDPGSGESSPGSNYVAGKIIAYPSTANCGFTWSTATTYGMLAMAVKTAQSNPLTRPRKPARRQAVRFHYQPR
jgi:hypothetical protein